MIASSKLRLEGSPLFSNPSLYRSTIGALQYLTMTRPDISFSVNKLSQFLQNPTVEHWGACKRVLRYLKGTIGLGLHFKPSTHLKIEAYSDADWASSVDDRKSTTGYCVFLGGNLVNWCSKKQSSVARSSTESEYRSLASTATEVAWLQSLLKELGICVDDTAVIWCDNMGAQYLASNPVFHARTKWMFDMSRPKTKQLIY